MKGCPAVISYLLQEVGGKSVWAHRLVVNRKKKKEQVYVCPKVPFLLWWAHTCSFFFLDNIRAHWTFGPRPALDSKSSFSLFILKFFLLATIKRRKTLANRTSMKWKVKELRIHVLLDGPKAQSSPISDLNS